MTENDATASGLFSPATNDTEELGRFLTSYRPDGVAPEVWMSVSEPAVSLVMRAGEPTRLRVEKDIQLLGAVVAHLVDRGRPITLEEALADTTLLSFDTSLRVAKKTRENKRGILRRLQAVQHGLPWRVERRADGERVKNLVSHTAVDTLNRLLVCAQSTASKDPAAAAFLEEVSRARELRAAGTAAPNLVSGTWERARSFASQHGWHLTRPVLRAVVTHEVLSQKEPVALLVAGYGLTRRDLDLALTGAVGLPDVPSDADRALLRGRTG